MSTDSYGPGLAEGAYGEYVARLRADGLRAAGQHGNDWREGAPAPPKPESITDQLGALIHCALNVRDALHDSRAVLDQAFSGGGSTEPSALSGVHPRAGGHPSLPIGINDRLAAIEEVLQNAHEVADRLRADLAARL